MGEAFGERIRRLRKERRLGLRATAEQVGITAGYLSRIVKGVALHAQRRGSLQPEWQWMGGRRSSWPRVFRSGRVSGLVRMEQADEGSDGPAVGGPADGAERLEA